VAMWGLAFKAGTDDVRESPALRVALNLQREGADVVVYDPEASSEQVTGAESALEAVRGADVLVVATEWPEFRDVDLDQARKLMRGHRIVDARNLLEPHKVRTAGFDYVGMGRPLA
jgi:UDPglucose 6-dehydrogenase